jgi:hypothetical protein
MRGSRVAGYCIGVLGGIALVAAAGAVHAPTRSPFTADAAAGSSAATSVTVVAHA